MPTSKVARSIGMTIFAVTIAISGCSNQDNLDQLALPAGSTVIALGDSLTFGQGASTDTAYPTVLAELSNWQVINTGINGNTSADVLARIKNITVQNPDLVLLGVGGNDVLRRVASETTRANITATIDKLQAVDIPVVLIAQPHFSVSALFGKVSDNPIYKDIANSEGIPLYANGWSAVLSDDTLKSDEIHANSAGYRQFAEDLYEYLQEEGVAK